VPTLLLAGVQAPRAHRPLAIDVAHSLDSRAARGEMHVGADRSGEII
jgi:hypothetical protein